MSEMEKCFLTGVDAEHTRPDNAKDTIIVDSPACGRYEISITAAKTISRKYSGQLHILAGAVRYRHEEGRETIITTSSIDQILDAVNPPKSVLEQIDLALLYIAQKASRPGQTVNIESSKHYPIIYGKNGGELAWVLRRLDEQHLVQWQGKDASNSGRIGVTPLGWQRVRELQKTSVKSDQAFVAMWFSEEVHDAWQEGIKPALDSLGWQGLRIDELEHNEMIDDKIVAEIRKSSLLVADFTGHRQGVYFEAGFALGLGIPVIWCCREDMIAEAHFDTRQYNHIVWTTPSDLREKLVNRIEALGLLMRPRSYQAPLQ